MCKKKSQQIAMPATGNNGIKNEKNDETKRLS